MNIFKFFFAVAFMVFAISCSEDEKVEAYDVDVIFDSTKGLVVIEADKSSFSEGEVVILKVEAKEEYLFSNWLGCPEIITSVESQEIVFSVYQDMELEAVFKDAEPKPTNFLTVNCNENQGSVQVVSLAEAYSSRDVVQ